MSAWDDAKTEFRDVGWVALGLLALIASGVLLFLGGANAFDFAEDPGSYAERHCGGALGGGDPGAPDTSECFYETLAKSEFEIAKWWLVGSAVALLISFGSFYAYARRSDNGSCAIAGISPR